MRRPLVALIPALAFAFAVTGCSSPAAPPPSAPASLDDAARGALAQIDGTLKAPGLKAPVEIIRDAAGIPHIYAQNDDDLFFAPYASAAT